MLEPVDRESWRADTSANGAGALEPIKAGGVELVVDLTKASALYDIRRASVDFSVPLVTDIEQAALLVRSLGAKPELEVLSHSDYFDPKEYFADAKPKPRPPVTSSPLEEEKSRLPGM